MKGEDGTTRERKEERQKMKEERQEKPDVIGPCKHRKQLGLHSEDNVKSSMGLIKVGGSCGFGFYAVWLSDE